MDDLVRGKIFRIIKGKPTIVDFGNVPSSGDLDIKAENGLTTFNRNFRIRPAQFTVIDTPTRENQRETVRNHDSIPKQSIITVYDK